MKKEGAASIRIAIGYEYKAGNNQDRLVLGYSKDGRVVYASRGGNKKNLYKERHICSKENFLKAVYLRSPVKVSARVLKSINVATRADSVIGK